MPKVSVLMPTYDREAFISRAIDSLLAQTYEKWELWIIDDGSTDNTAAVIQHYLMDPRIHYQRLETNRGLGYALNMGLNLATGSLIAYLPSDDVYYQDHLESLVKVFATHPEVILAYSGLRHHYNRTCAGILEDYSLQMVQTMHRNTPDRWKTREELVTDDLDRMYWDEVKPRGEIWSTGQVTCEWVDHPDQLHKLLREPIGGINPFRQKFNIQHPLRFHTTMGNHIDEVEHYRRFRERPDTPPAPDGLRILLVGELAYNSERVLALEERGHQLYGLWMPEPYWYNAVGPMPFGHVTDLPRDRWREAVRALKPDIIYALLNWQAVPFVHEVLTAFPDIPFVWHFKEGPFISLEKGHWAQLVDIYRRSDAHVYSTPEMRLWFETIIPEAVRGRDSLILDGDLPKKEWLEGERSPRIHSEPGEYHTVVPGRPIGLHPENVREMADNGIHLHFYGNFTHGQWLSWIEKTQRLAPGFLHLHDNVDQENWLKEFSQYDAGWLHFFESQNFGEIRRSNWDDLNLPARLSTLVLAGLPVLQRDNTGSIVATQNLVEQLDIGLFFKNMQELRTQLDDSARMARLRENVWSSRPLITFDHYADLLIDFFREVINRKENHRLGLFGPIHTEVATLRSLIPTTGQPGDASPSESNGAGDQKE